MSAPAPERDAVRTGGRRRPIAVLIAVFVGLGGIGAAAGMVLGGVGAASSAQIGPSHIHDGPMHHPRMLPP